MQGSWLPSPCGSASLLMDISDAKANAGLNENDCNKDNEKISDYRGRKEKQKQGSKKYRVCGTLRLRYVGKVWGMRLPYVSEQGGSQEIHPLTSLSSSRIPHFQNWTIIQKAGEFTDPVHTGWPLGHNRGRRVEWVFRGEQKIAQESQHFWGESSIIRLVFYRD